MRDWRGELAGLGQTRTKETGDLLDQGVGGDEGIVLARELLDELLVLVQLLQVVGGHGVDTVVLRAIDVVLVTEDADGHAGPGNGGQLDGAGETLVSLGVLRRSQRQLTTPSNREPHIVLEADLQLDGLEEVSLLLLGVLEEFLDVGTNAGHRDFRHDVSLDSKWNVWCSQWVGVRRCLRLKRRGELAMVEARKKLFARVVELAYASCFGCADVEPAVGVEA